MEPDNIQLENLEDPTAWKTLGDLNFSEGHYDAAIEYYVHAVELNPEYLEAWNKILLSLLELGRTEDAKVINSKINELKNKTQTTSQGEGSNDGSIPSKFDIKQKNYELPWPEMLPEKNKFHKILYLTGILVIVVIFAVFIFGSGGQQPSKNPSQQRETILNTSLIVSGWWFHNISGGHTYEIYVSSNKPVTLYMCEFIDYQQEGLRGCRGSGFQTIFESITSFKSNVYFPPEVRYIFLLTKNNDTNFDLKITRIS